MIRSSAAAIANRRNLNRIRALRFTKAGFDRSIWRTMCDLGWLGLHLPEEHSGVGLGMSEFCALAEELGAGLVPEPLIGAALVARALPPAKLADLLSGEKIVLPAWQESAHHPQRDVDTQLTAGRLFGCKRFVWMAAGADAFLVLTTAGGALVSADAQRLRIEILSTQDGGHYGTLTFDGAPAEPIQATFTRALSEATLATAAYLAGLIDAALSRTLEYLRTRVQFGVSIGRFQALQHRAVDLKLQAALTRASVEEAARIWDLDPGGSFALAAISRAKARASMAALLVTRQAIQLHGGIGYTDEHDIGLFLRKAMVLCPQFGGANEHRRRYAELMPQGQSDL
ncbi:MAG: acyl-CoA/acyl-ACP dehydrogenase [Pseudomonadota bacterium]|nr:acyl-CoA/acyl-ACP dehydrogenase [Pseudomonadota bacterium]